MSGVAPVELIDGTLSGLLIDTSSGLTEFVRQRVGGSWPLVPDRDRVRHDGTLYASNFGLVRRRSGSDNSQNRDRLADDPLNRW